MLILIISPNFHKNLLIDFFISRFLSFHVSFYQIQVLNNSRNYSIDPANHNSSTSDYGSAGGGSSGHATPPSRGKIYAPGEAEMRPQGNYFPPQQFGSHMSGGGGGGGAGSVGGGSTKDVYNSGHIASTGMYRIAFSSVLFIQ